MCLQHHLLLEGGNEYTTNLRDFKGEKFGCSMVHSSFGWFHARVLVGSESKKNNQKLITCWSLLNVQANNNEDLRIKS